MTRHRGVLAAAAAAIAVVLVAGCGIEPAKSDETSRESPAAAAKTPSPVDTRPIAVDAGTLIRERAPKTGKYSGKTLEITGTVKGAGHDLGNNYVDLLDDDHPDRDPFATYVSLETSYADVAKFEEGQVVTVLAKKAKANKFVDGSIVVMAELVRIVR